MLEFRLLGPLEVSRDGAPLPIGSRRQRALLAFLLLRANVSVSTDELIEELWPGDPPPTARASLQNHVSRLRRLLGSNVIETTAAGYRVRVDRRALDLSCVEELLARARDVPAALRADLLREALQQWRGLPLVEFPAEPFAQAEVSRLEELRLLATEERIAADLELSRHGDLVPELETLVQQHPLRERLWEQLMLALYRSGRQAEALACYRRAHDAFVDELGLEPGARLKELQRAILIQKPDPGSSDENADLFRRAVDELPLPDAARARALLAYGQAIWRLGERQRADLAVAEASKRAAAAGDEVLEQQARLQLSLNRFLTNATSLAEHARQARLAAKLFADAGELDALADALLQEAHMLRDGGNAEESAALAERAADVARQSGNTEMRRRADGYLAAALAIGPIPVPEALARCPAADGDAGYGVHCGRGYLLVQSGAVDDGLQLVQRGIELARQRSLPSSLSGAFHWLAFCREILGEDAAAAASLRTAYELAEAVAEQASLAASAARLSRALAAVGDVREAQKVLERAESTPDDRATQIYAALARAHICSRNGRLIEARRHARAAIELADTTDWHNTRALAHECLAIVSPSDRRHALDSAIAHYALKENRIAEARLRQAAR